MRFSPIGILTSVLLASVPIGAYEIRLPEQPTAEEVTAAAELKHYLELVSAGDVSLGGNSEVIFHVGDTPAARECGLGAEKMESERYHIRSRGNTDVVLVGGGSRGSLYAVYHFIEDILGVTWFNPYEEFVPPQAPVKLPELDMTGRPVMMQREIYYSGTQHRDSGRFVARMRLNRNDSDRPGAQYGGVLDFGPPYQVHTFFFYLSDTDYFAKHPEYFALVDGKRVGGRNSQLCLSNPDVRDIFTAKLKENIARGEAEAAREGLPAPLIYDLSTNDSFNPCECDACQAIVRREGNETGALLDFVNDIADRIREEHPGVLISTLAYQYTDEPPSSGLAPRDNVMIRLCDTRTNQAKSFEAPENRDFLRLLRAWSRIAKHLYIWDYSITYTMTGLPYPQEYTLSANLRSLADNNYRYCFFEHEYPESADMFDFIVWLEAKLLENPYADADALREHFLTRYYGAAAPMIQAYRELIRDAAEASDAYIHWFAPPYQFNHLNLATVAQANTLLEEAKRLVANDPVLAPRVERARLGLDRAIYLRHRLLLLEHLAAGGSLENYPLDRDAALARAEKSWSAACERLAPTARNEAKTAMRRELTTYRALPFQAALTLPERFHKDAGVVVDFPADAANFSAGHLALVTDAEAEAGYAIRAEMKDAGAPVAPLTTGLLVRETDERYSSLTVKPEDIPGPGYHWYKVGPVKRNPTVLLYTMNDWSLHFPVAPAVPQLAPDRDYEVWIKLKFVSPGLPYGQPGDETAIYFERVTIAEAE